MLPGRKYAPEDLIAIAWRHKWLIVIAVCLVTSAAIAFSLRLPDLYRSQTMILVIPQRVPESYVRSTVTMRIEDRLRSLRQQILSRTRLERIIRDFGLYEEELQTTPMEQIVDEMRLQVGVDTVRDDAFTVSFVASNPRTAMIVTDRLASIFIEENMKDREGQADGTNQFLDSQLTEARTRLITQEERLEAYRRQYSGELPTQLQSNLNIMQSTQAQIQTLTESISRDHERRLLLEQSLNEAQTAPAGSIPADTSIPPTEESRLLDELTRARNEFQSMRQRLKPEHPDVLAKGRAIAQLESKLGDLGALAPSEPGSAQPPQSAANVGRSTRARRIQAEIDKLDAQTSNKEAEIQRLRQLMSDYQRKVDAVPGHESELLNLMRDYDTLRSVYTDLLGKKENSQISANLERQQVGEQFRILDPARLPEKPFSPNRPQLAGMAAAGGLMFAIVLIAFFEYRDVTLRTEDEIVRTLVLPVVAAIPIMAAVADVRRQRRNSALVGVATVMAVASLGVAVWKMIQ